ncbi:alkaline phosphatase family protein [Lawsonibacter sp. LCP25S3_G6]|uniref:alkaline phosphatase family protein n=1 Tax=unclassified Lawsonibacter TaxID=2617946 RepID=UPI003F99E58D
MKKRILVYSVDAMVCEDVEALRKMPNFQKYLAGGCEVTGGMRTVYPSVTYPAHVSMMTGCYAGKHGITSNFSFTTTNKDDKWLWFSQPIQVEDIFSAAKKAGYTTGAISWPVTAGNENVDWLMAEYWMPNPGDTLRSSFADAGSSPEMLDIIEANARYLPKGYEKGGKKNFMQWPVVDDFIIHVAADVIREHAPQVMFVHTGTFDSYRHAHGVFSSYLDEARANLDRYIGELMDACRAAGVEQETNFVLVSDHGQRDICRAINLNVLLADHGLIRVDEDGKVIDWQAYCFSNAMSSNVYLKHPEDAALKERVYGLLNELREEGVYGIGRVFTAEEAWEEEHLRGEFSFVIESDGYTSFGDRAVRPLVQNFDVSDYRFGRATHGYLPDLGAQPVFVAKGPDFQENKVLDRGLVVDEAPTYAKMLGIQLPQADGKPMDAFLK